jgi:ketosteroid isomerase-like protein
LGGAFAHALARQDFQELSALLHEDIELRALTPRRAWTPENHSQALEVLQRWFGDCEIEQVVCLDTDAFADCQRVAYRFRGHRSDGPFVIEQQVYFCERDGQIDWMRIMCSGFRAP